MTKQSTNHVLMVWSPGFRSNAQTLETNFAQTSDVSCSVESIDQITSTAYKEFINLKHKLEEKGIRVTVKEGAPTSPDSIFPNNTFSTHSAEECGQSTAVFYPMLAPNRQAELCKSRQNELRKNYDHVIDMRPYFEQGKILEGTGSLVLDRVHKIAYACHSPRTDKPLMQDWCAEMGYKPVFFNALDSNGHMVYHTNVVMWVGSSISGICLEAIPNTDERDMVKASLENSGKTVISLTKKQMDAPHFAANALEVLDNKGKPVLALSSAAWAAYTKEQKTVVENAFNGGIVDAPIPTIEKYGGGSVRCMLAELF